MKIRTACKVATVAADATIAMGGPVWAGIVALHYAGKARKAVKR